MNRIVIIILGLLLLVGGGGGAFYWFYLRAPAFETTEQAALRVKKEEEAKEKERKEATPVWHELANIPAPIYLNGKVRAYMFIGFKLDLADPEVGTKLDAAGPQLTERMLIEVNEHPIKLIEGTNNPDLMELKRRIKGMVESEYGHDTVHDVLITMTYLQPF